MRVKGFNQDGRRPRHHRIPHKKTDLGFIRLLQQLNYSGLEALEEQHEATARLRARCSQPRIRLLNETGVERPVSTNKSDH